MSTTVNITTSYQGKAAAEYISAALLAGNTIAQGGIDVRPNVRFKEVLRRIDLSSIVSDASCDFTPSGQLDLTERVLEVKALQVNLILCKDDFLQSWEAAEMMPSAYADLPSNFTDFVISRIIGTVAEKTEQDLWAGASASGAFEGFLSKLTTGSASLAGNITGTTITAANVIDELGKVVDAINPELYGRDSLHIYVPQNVARAYVRALGGFGANGLGGSGTAAMGTQWYNNGSLSFDGVKIFVANGLSSNTMVATIKENLVFGTSLLDDHQEVRLIDTSETLGDRNLRFVMRYYAGVQIAVLEDCVAYGL